MAAGDVHASAVARLLRDRLVDAPLEFPVRGSSMSGVIESGSRVFVERASAPRRGEIWAFVDHSGAVVVHRVRELGGGLVVGRGAANPIDDDGLPIDRLVGRVRQVVGPDGRRRSFGPVDRLKAAAEFSLRRRVRRWRRGG